MRCPLISERGGVAILLVLAFMAFGVPIITAALKLSSTIAIDSRVKTNILKRQYCDLGVREYIRYLALDPERWLAWFEDNPGGEETLTFCDDQITLTATELPASPGDSPGYSFQEIQSGFKEVTPNKATLNTLTTFTYTITLKNQGTSAISLEKLIDYLPPLFQYTDNTTEGFFNGVLNFSGNPDISLAAGDQRCGDEPDQLTWDFSPVIVIAPQDIQTLTFEATGTLPDGIYYNKVTMSYLIGDPASTVEVHTPYTAEVTVGNGGTKCGFNLELLVRKKVTDIRILAPGETQITYTVSVENVTSNALPVTKIVDILPPGFIYQAGSSSGISSSDPTSVPAPCTQPPDITGLQRCTLTWETGDDDVPLFTIAAGQELIQTLKATTKADPGLAFFNEIQLIYNPVGFNSWAIAFADTVLLLDNSGSVDDCQLVQLRQAANAMVDGFSLETTEGRIRIGLTRFGGQSSSVADMTDVDSHSPAPINATLYFPNSGGGSPYPLGTVQGCASTQGSHTPAEGTDFSVEGEWEEVSDFWETTAFGSAGSISAATWAFTQWIESGHSQNRWRWKLQLVEDGGGIVTVFTTASATTPPNFDDEVLSFAHPSSIDVEVGDKLRVRVEVWSDKSNVNQRLFQYRWGGADEHSSFLKITTGASSNHTLHDGIDENLAPAPSQGGGANLVSAFNFVTGTQFDSGLGDRAEVPNLLIVIVDGSSMPGQSIANASAGSGAEVFAVGVGAAADVDGEDLFAIAYDPDDPDAEFDATNPDPYYSDHVFHADDFQALLDLVGAIVEAALAAVQTVVTAEGGSSTGGTLYNMTAVSPDGTVTQYRAIVTSDGEVTILDWPQ